MIKKILVPIDGSEHASSAIEFAANMAKQNDAATHLLHVVKPDNIPEGVMDYIRVERIDETPEAVYTKVVGDHFINAARDEAKKKGVKHIETSVITGDPAETIIDYARNHDFDVIVMGSRGTGSDQGLMLGSVSSKVSHATDRTCVIVRKRLLDGKKILIVDDEPDVLETLEELLPMCDVVKASTFDKGKELLATQDFDMAILDIMGVEGFQLLEVANEKKVIAVMLTAHALSPENTLRAYKEGAASYIPKDEMADITTFLSDILEAKEKGKHSWWRWLERFGSYYNKKFASEWKNKDIQN